MHLSLSILVISSTILYAIGNQANFKYALREANVYDEFVPSLLDTIEQSTAERPNDEQPSEQNPFDNADVREIVKQSVDPNLLKSQLEPALDEVTNWLKGDSDKLNINIDLSPIKSTLTSQLTAYADNRMTSLPPCTPQDVQAIDQTDFLTLTCRPPDFNVSQVKENIDETLKEVDFVITNKTFQKTATDPTIEDKLSNVKMAYNGLQSIFYGSIVLTALSLAAFVFARRPWKEAFYELGKSLSITGLLTVMPVIAGILIVPRLVQNIESRQNQLVSLGANAASIFATKILTFVLYWGIAFCLFGVILMIVDRKRGSSTQSRK